MERNAPDSNSNSRLNNQRSDDSGSKTPKIDKVVKDTNEKLNDNLNKK